MCSSGCPTQNHKSYGECLRSKNLEISDPEAHRHNSSMHKTIDEYVALRRAGIQPSGVTKKDVKTAREMTDLLGKPFRADE